ncbi:MAG: flagellar biosynthetic protein FliO [Pseudomonadota bacterium]
MKVFLLSAIFLVISSGSYDTRTWALDHPAGPDKSHTWLEMSETSRGSPTGEKQVDLFSSTLKMIGSLAFVLAGILVTFWIIKKFLSKGGKVFGGRDVIRILATTYLGQKKVISVVEVADELLVLGITSNHISLLTKIEDGGKIEEIKNVYSQRGNRSSFEYQLRRVSSKLKGARREETLSGLTNSIKERVSKLKDM